MTDAVVEGRERSRPMVAPARVGRFTRTARAQTAPVTETNEVDDWAASDLAWELADAINPLIADRDRAQLYATIGSGESYAAIDAVLQTIAHRRLPITGELVAKVANWLDAYAYSSDASRLHELLHAIRSLR